MPTNLKYLLDMSIENDDQTNHTNGTEHSQIKQPEIITTTETLRKMLDLAVVNQQDII